MILKLLFKFIKLIHEVALFQWYLVHHIKRLLALSGSLVLAAKCLVLVDSSTYRVTHSPTLEATHIESEATSVVLGVEQVKHVAHLGLVSLRILFHGLNHGLQMVFLVLKDTLLNAGLFHLGNHVWRHRIVERLKCTLLLVRLVIQGSLVGWSSDALGFEYDITNFHVFLTHLCHLID